MADAVFSNYSIGSYNSASVSHTATAGDTFAIVVCWQMMVGEGWNIPTPSPSSAPTYGGQAMTAYLGCCSNYGGSGDANSSSAGAFVYLLNGGVPSGAQTVTFGVYDSMRPWIGVMTGKYVSTTPEDSEQQNNAGGGSYSLTLSPITVGAFTFLCGTGSTGASGDGTECWSLYHDESDNRWDKWFFCEYWISTGTTKTYDKLFGGTEGLYGCSLPFETFDGQWILRPGGIPPTSRQSKLRRGQRWGYS